MLVVFGYLEDEGESQSLGDTGGHVVNGLCNVRVPGVEEILYLLLSVNGHTSSRS